MSGWWLLLIPAALALRVGIDTRNYLRGYRGWRTKR